ncbi:hypothetical protein [Crocosphaera chwakensis]|uniref:Uncharacterized protein n=1 Tax=Crocosphaera chwakensis CCY0110 TaxID=391612 RepID=A3IYH9_9CHRO|nr:hypothetical protein [Crocosphaera chwakensis]EAZ88469.1 hypothetical protein CY0110_26939 [Crocosphaera chwakensis CCY0110]
MRITPKGMSILELYCLYSLKSLQEKMIEYLENGTKLGWLINPKDKEEET